MSARSSTLLVLILGLCCARCAVTSPPDPFAGTYTATKWIFIPDRGVGTDMIAQGGVMIVTLREDLVASVQVAFPDTGQPDSFGQLVGHWEALSQGVVITWNEDEEAYPLPDLELEGTGNRLEGGGFHPCCEGGVELTLVRS